MLGENKFMEDEFYKRIAELRQKKVYPPEK